MKKAPLILALLPTLALATSGLNLSWTAPTTNTDGTAITAPLTYNVYSGASGVETLTTTGITGTTDVLAATAGVKDCVQVTAVANGVESARTAEVCATPSFPTPNAPTGLMAH